MLIVGFTNHHHHGDHHMLTRTTDARPGSAWDTWHKAGFDYVMGAPGVSLNELTLYATRYAVASGCRVESVKQAFRLGAMQALHSA